MPTSGARRLRNPQQFCSACRRCGLPDDVALVKLVDRVDAALRAAGTPRRAVDEKAYLKSDLAFYGVTVPAMRRIVLDEIRAAEGEREAAFSHDDVVALTTALWAPAVHERRAAAAELLEAKVSLLGVTDLPLLERLLRESRTWALVDGLSASVVGPIVRDNAVAARTTDRWLHDDDFWIRRAALLSLLLGVRTGKPDLDRLSGYCDALLEEKEFFIRKAVGWLLREQAKRDPAWVTAWLEPRLPRASGVTVREAVRPLDPDVRDRLVAAYQGSRA